MEEITQVEQIETTEQVEQEVSETVSKADYDALKIELEELRGKLPQEQSETQKELQKLRKESFASSVKWELKDNGFGQFVPLFINKVQNEDELSNVIDTLKEIYKQDKMNNSYVPSGASSTTQYEEAQAKKDVGSMISAKFSKLFGK
ncbi:hypothetical protein ACIQ4I_15410 [Rummeliibacillus sp. NPDC094406]|uniref:hypothetical protein n=1 Tax=Rummeliibacillus sp. NPDC094406 TaxID=3364511 RepID=UPI0038212078